MSTAQRKKLKVSPVVNRIFAGDPLPRCERPHPLYYLGALPILMLWLGFWVPILKRFPYLNTLPNYTLS